MGLRNANRLGGIDNLSDFRSSGSEFNTPRVNVVIPKVTTISGKKPLDIEGVSAPKAAPATPAAPEVPKSDTAKELQTSRELGSLLGVASAVGNIINAQSQYNQIEAKARLNIQLAGHQAAEAISIGKEQALREESKGISRGKSALLAAAVQGQDVSGALATSLQRNEEIFGAANAMQAEVNSIRQAFGYRAQQIQYQSEVSQAKSARNSAVATSVLQGGLSVLGGFL